MARVGLAPEMMARLGIVFAAAVCIPALIHGVVLNAPGRNPTPIAASAEKVAGNPYGTISPNVSFANRSHDADPSKLSQVVRGKPKGTSSITGKMPIGCDALGGVSTRLAHIAGKCLT